MSDIFVKGEGGFQFVDLDEPMTPADTDRYLRRLNNELVISQLAVTRARGEEIDAQKMYAATRNPLLMDPSCPKVGSRAGQVSAKERDLWISARIPGAYWALEEAKLVRTNAVDYAWQVKTQAGLMQSLNNNAKAIYGTPGSGR